MPNQLTDLIAAYEATNSEEALAVLCDYLEERGDPMAEWWRREMGLVRVSAEWIWSGSSKSGSKWGSLSVSESGARSVSWSRSAAGQAALSSAAGLESEIGAMPGSRSTWFSRTWSTSWSDELMKCKTGDTVLCAGVRWNYIGKISQISSLDITIEDAVKVFEIRQTEDGVMAEGITDTSKCEFVGERCLSRAGLKVMKWKHPIAKAANGI